MKSNLQPIMNNRASRSLSKLNLNCYFLQLLLSVGGLPLHYRHITAIYWTEVCAVNDKLQSQMLGLFVHHFIRLINQVIFI